MCTSGHGICTNLRTIIHKLINNYIQTNYTHKVAKVES